MFLKCFSWLFILVSFNAYANTQEVKIKDLPIDGIKPKKYGTLAVFQEPVLINENTEADKETDYGIIKQSESCTVLSDTKIYKDMEIRDISHQEIYRLSLVQPKTENQKFTLIFMAYFRTPLSFFVECDNLDENSTVAELESAVEKLFEIRLGSAIDSTAILAKQ